MFIKSKERLIKKFKILQSEFIYNKSNKKLTKYTKNVILNLCDTKIPENQIDLLNLGPHFAPSLRSIPYMDIITITESSDLKLEYNKEIETAQNLRKNVLRELKMGKTINHNLTRDQRKAFKEIIQDKKIDIYPFDKGIRFERIEHDKAIEKIREQIGPTKIISIDPTLSYAARIKSFLSKLNKKQRFSNDEYESVYPSDPASSAYNII
ncbi:uncharacterized protein LOC136094457 [Hydra vulgaris]|uniref:uncharacterized protein LOC136094457 n=1 Tax=Hydra vulgaris TaxID=6087 RepID=UPI0032EA1901